MSLLDIDNTYNIIDEYVLKDILVKYIPLTRRPKILNKILNNEITFKVNLHGYNINQINDKSNYWFGYDILNEPVSKFSYKTTGIEMHLVHYKDMPNVDYYSIGKNLEEIYREMHQNH